MGCRRRGPALVPARARRAPQHAIGHAAEAVGFPCVVKAVSLSASQGILRADDPAAAVTAARRIRQVLAAAGRPAGEPVLVEEYLPGPELSIDGLLTGGDLTVTAIFDKPATPDGPTFEETLLVTPSRLPPPVLTARPSIATGLTLVSPPTSRHHHLERPGLDVQLGKARGGLDPYPVLGRVELRARAGLAEEDPA
jgi:hypothetical protein